MKCLIVNIFIVQCFPTAGRGGAASSVALRERGGLSR